MNVLFLLGFIFRNTACEGGDIFFYVLKSFHQNNMQFGVHRIQSIKDKTSFPVDQLG